MSKKWEIISSLAVRIITLIIISFPGSAPPAATVVIVVCIAALVVIVVIGVYRIHATHQEGSREDEDEVKDPEEEWNNSALTITVNPMEVTFIDIINKV